MSARRVVVTGSVAFDYLMTFSDRFLDVLVPDRMHRLSVSFRVDAMRRVRGGCAPNIAYSLARLGADAVIMATAGSDAREYRDWLAEAGVDVSLLRIYDDIFTASFFVTTDRDQNQVGTFYSGAMDRARDLSFDAVDPAAVAMAIIAPNDPQAMARYARECRALRIPFMYDPSQQVAQLGGEDLLAGLEGAAIFIGNEYEFGVIEKKTELAEAELLRPGSRADRHARERGLDDRAPRRRADRHRAAGAGRGHGGRPDRRRRRISGRTPRGAAGRVALGRRGTGRQHRRGLRARDHRAAAAALHAGRVPRPLPGQLRWRGHVAAAPPGGLSAPAEATLRTSPALSVVVPVYDEVECLERLVGELRAALDEIGRPAEIIAVDDGSADGSFERLVELRATEPRLRVVRLQRNYGQTAAMAAGIELARGDVIASLDADLQNDPRDITRLLAALGDDVDVVNGWRRERQDPWLTRLLPSRIANRIISAVTGTSLHDYGCTLRVMRASVAKELRLYGELHRFIPALAADLGARVVEVPVAHRPRTLGRSKYGLSRTLRVLLDLMTVKFLSGFAGRPIQLFGLMGLGLAVPGLVLIAALGFERLFLGVRLAGRPIVLLAILLTVLGVQFVSIGLLGEMMVRTYHESQGKPIFRIRTVVDGGAPELTSQGPAANPAAL